MRFWSSKLLAFPVAAALISPAAAQAQAREPQLVVPWLKAGARPSDSVRTLIAKHLSRDLSVPAAPAEAPAAQ